MNWINKLKSSLHFKGLSITSVYIISLSSIALMAIVFQIVKFTIHREQLRTIEAIVAIEHQKAKMEKAHSKTLDAQLSIQNSPTLANRHIKKAISAISSRNKNLIKVLPHGICQKVACDFFLDKKYFSFTASLQPLTDESIEDILQKIATYQKFLEHVTDRLDTKVNDSTKMIINLDMLFLLLLLIVLFMQAFFGFKPAVRKLNEALSARSDFLSRISHEIRNPMNSILGMVDILKTTKLNTEQKQYINNLQRSSHVLLDMLNNLVDFSGLENRRIKLKEVRFNLYEMVDKITDIISIQAHDKNLEILVDIDPKIPSIQGDVVKLEQVIINLMNNALKFTDKGFISLKISQIPSGTPEDKVTLHFEIEDSGIGIDESKLTEVFNSFVQEDSSIQRQYGGSGLGLAICKEIVELMGSKIAVSSQKNQGSCFHFDIEFTKTQEVSNENIELFNNRIIFVTGFYEYNRLQPYLQRLTNNFVIIRDLQNLKKELVKEPDKTLVIVDDSLGIINMLNASTIISKHISFDSVYALMRSNFSKENLELLRNKQYKNYLIKPFRAWRLFNSLENNKVIEHESETIVDYKSLQGEMKGRKPSILAVDDSNDNLFLIREILSPITDQIDFASNGLEACEQVDKKPYDIIFMDIQMPIMDGYSAIKKLRQNYKKIPVFAVTAHAGIVDEKKCIEAGFNGRITKPITRENIYNTIQEIFDLPIPFFRTETLTPEQKMIQKLMPQYFVTRMNDLQTLQQAIKNQDFTTIQKIGHRVKGSAKSYGFDQVGELSQELEWAAENSNEKKCQQIVDQMEDHILAAKRKFETSSSPQK